MILLRFFFFSPPARPCVIITPTVIVTFAKAQAQAFNHGGQHNEKYQVWSLGGTGLGLEENGTMTKFHALLGKADYLFKACVRVSE